MRRLVEYGVNHRVVVYFLCAIITIGGIVSFFSLGKLEDPVYTVKTATVITRYPGASPTEVELEVTDKIETALQEMSQLKHLYSISRAGESYIKVSIKEQYWADRLPQVWDELRKKVSNVVPSLPPGAEQPKVNDDYGAVYGFLLALTGDGYSYKDLEEYAKLIKKEASLEPGVSRVELWGAQQKVVYLDISENQLAELRLTPETMEHTLRYQNMVVDAGFIDDTTNRYRVSPTGEFTSPEQIGELLLRPAANDIITNVIDLSKETGKEIQDLSQVMEEEGDQVFRVADVARVRPGYQEPPFTLMRFNGKPAIGLAIAGRDDANIIDVGRALSDRLGMIEDHLPVGLQMHKIAWQSDLVSEAINGFLISLLEAVIIVLIVLMIPSGLRMGMIVGSGLMLTILGTFIVMAILDIPLQRMSLGALVIALGMMVDNSIVVADGIAVKIRQGMPRAQAAVEGGITNGWPLLGATLIATLAFYPIFASREDAGEYCRTLFIVVGTSLVLSWVLAMLVTPLQCIDLLTEAKESDKGEFDRPLFRFFRWIVQKLIKWRLLTIIGLVGLLVLSLLGFGFVRQIFFPDSTRPQLMVDYWAPYGTRIQDVSSGIQLLEEELLKDPLVTNITTFVGAGPPRFYLPVDPERPYQNYGQLIVNVKRYQDVEPVIAKYAPWAAEHTAGAMARFRKYSVGPSNTWKFEARISGPGEADLTTLRTLGEEVKTIAATSPLGTDWRTDMMNQTLKVVPAYDQKQGRWASVSRVDVAHATKRSYDGRQVGLYREGDTLYPIVLRNIESEREELLTNLEMLQVKPEGATTTVPLSVVVDGVKTQWEDPMIIRWDRRRAVTVQGSAREGVTFDELRSGVIKEIEKVPLPPGYTIFWDGEQDSKVSAQKSLIPGIVPAAIAVLIILVALFNAFRPVLIILLTIPFALIGITAGLLIFNLPFGFMALLGAMSLAGMMNKNIVVLLDAADLNVASGMDRAAAIVEASISRARPVLLAAITTILGVVPLLADVFWVSMAGTIMAGLAFGSLLTLIAVPVFYAFFYRVKR